MFEFLKRLFGGKKAQTATDKPRVSEALRREGSDEDVREAVNAIDAVHRDGRLPPVRVVRALFTSKHGRFAILDTGEIIIQISYFSQHAAFTLVHEVGHFLDYSGLNQPGELASPASSALAPWRLAVSQSRAVQRLKPLLLSGSSKATETLPDGTMVEYDIDVAYLRYLLLPQELWARSYAQFIATRSGSADLRQQLTRLRDRPAHTFYYGEQWEDTDFLPIMTEIEPLFRRIGWM